MRCGGTGTVGLLCFIFILYWFGIRAAPTGLWALIWNRSQDFVRRSGGLHPGLFSRRPSGTFWTTEAVPIDASHGVRGAKKERRGRVRRAAKILVISKSIAGGARRLEFERAVE